MDVEIHIPIRAACLRPADEGWERPRGAEVQEVVRRTGLSGRAVGRALGLSEHGGRQVRRWVSEDAPITYTAWAVLCDMVGLGRIWQNFGTEGDYTSELPLTEQAVNAAMTWWGTLTESERSGWLERAGTDSTPARAWLAYQAAARSATHRD
jgi:hypothetical protein